MKTILILFQKLKKNIIPSENKCERSGKTHIMKLKEAGVKIHRFPVPGVCCENQFVAQPSAWWQRLHCKEKIPGHCRDKAWHCWELHSTKQRRSASMCSWLCPKTQWAMSRRNSLLWKVEREVQGMIPKEENIGKLFFSGQQHSEPQYGRNKKLLSAGSYSQPVWEELGGLSDGLSAALWPLKMHP